MRFFKAVLLASAVFVLGGQSACGDSGERVEEGLTPDKLRAKWESERQGKTVGQTATFEVTGSPLVLTTTGTADFAAPMTLTVAPIFPKKKQYVFFENAQVGSQTGLLVLEGTKLSLTAGTLGRVEITGALARTHLPEGSAAPAIVLTVPKDLFAKDPVATYPADWPDAETALFYASPYAVHPSGMTLTGFTRGVLLTGSGATAISGSVTVTSADRMFWDDDSIFETPASLIECPRFALGGTPTGGSLQSTGPSASPPPGGIIGEQGRVRLEPGRARSEGSFQLTQALAASGPLVPAEVQVAFDPKPLTVARSGRGLVTVVYREKTLRGDAVLGDIQITGSGKEAVSVAIDEPETLLRNLWARMAETNTTNPIFTVPVVFASPFIAIGESLSCLFSTCPEAYPSWGEAGSVGRFHIIVRGTLPPGKYSVDVTMTGRNYAPFTIPVQFTLPE